jgi:hypothetical protein
MKTNLFWWIGGFVVLVILLVILIIGRGQLTDLEEQNADLETQVGNLQAQMSTLQFSLNQTKNELTEIKKVYPPRNFNSLSELTDWLSQNNISERPLSVSYEEWYTNALELQSDAFSDGFIISVDYDWNYDSELEEEYYSIWCVTVIDGVLWYWDPETDDIFEDFTFGRLG